MGPLIDCLRSVGGSARPREVILWIQDHLKVPPEATATTLKSGQSRFYNQVHWARQYLVWEGFIDDGKRGIWALTPLGWKTQIDDAAARQIFLQRVQINQAARKQAVPDQLSSEPTDLQEALPLDVIQELKLIDVLKSLDPIGFERLCTRLLHEHGFENVQVTQQSRDGGIDGYGVLRLSPFVSMKVAFQAKRYKEVVSRATVSQFRSDFLGRAEKGVFITTGRFTSDAEAEAERDGVVPIELVDGERLVELFEKAELGVKPKQVFEIDQAFFDQFRKS